VGLLEEYAHDPYSLHLASTLEQLNERFRELLMEYLTDIAYQTEPGKYNWHPAIELADQCELGEPFPDGDIYGWLAEGEWYPNRGYNPGRWAYKQARDQLANEMMSGMIGDESISTTLYFIDGASKDPCEICAMYEGRILNEEELMHAMSMGLFHPHCAHYPVPIEMTDDLRDIIERERD